MIEGLSARGQCAMSHATTMATELGHPAIESEHVLLGIAFVAGPGQSILRSMGLEYDPLEVRVRSRLCARHLGDVEREPIPGAQLRRIMKYAKTEAADSDSRQIDTDHMLIAISKDPGCTAMCIMAAFLPPCNLREKITEAASNQHELTHMV